MTQITTNKECLEKDTWKQVSLKDIAIKRKKKNKDISYTTVFSNSALNGIVEQTNYFDKKIANKDNLSSYFIVEKDDFVYNPRISSYAPYGPIRRNKTNKTGVVSPLYKVFRLDSNKCNLDYFEQYFKSSCWHRYIYGVANYGARSDRMNITDSDFFNMKIRVPNLSEQEKIASILLTWDKAIELKEKLIEQKKELKKGLMQKLLTGEVRLPGYKGVWKEVKLGDLGECIRGVSYKPDDLYLQDNPNSIRLLRANNVKDGTLNNDDIQYVDKSKVKEIQLLRKNDLVISMANGSKKLVGKNGVYKSLDNYKYTVGAFCAIFRFNNKCSPHYAKYLFQTDKYNYFVQTLIAGSNINNLKPSDIESMRFMVPVDKEEQKGIATILDQVTTEINLIDEEIKFLKLQKKGLMQLMLTGKIRVKV